MAETDPASVEATIVTVVIFALVIGGMFLLCAVIAAAIAGGKGRSRLLGFVLGGCFGIFGIAAAAIMGEGTDRARQKRIERLQEERLMAEALAAPRRRREIADEWDDDDWEEAEVEPSRRLTGGYRMLPRRPRRRG